MDPGSEMFKRPLMHPLPKQLILGHRGAPREATENTLRSLSRAVELGADGVELDVQRSADGVPVVIHDETLDRTTNARGRVAALRWSAIERLTGANVPSLQQALAWGSAAGAWLNVEIKSRNVEREVVDLVGTMGLADRVIISSFDPSVVLRVGQIDGSIRRFLLTERWDSQAIRSFEEANAHGVCLRDDAASELALDGLSREGIPVVVWTVNAEDRIRHLLRRKVAGLISDDPELAARIRSSLGASGSPRDLDG
jgi:glycerophosphoryl diester phosphodiesterase